MPIMHEGGYEHIQLEAMPIMHGIILILQFYRDYANIA